MVSFGGMKWLDWIVLIGTIAAIYTIVGDPAIRGPYAVSVLAASLSMTIAYFVFKSSKYIKNSLFVPAIGIIAFFVVNGMPWVKQIRFEVLDTTSSWGSYVTLPTYWVIGILAAIAIYILHTRQVINLRQILHF